ncbi:MAG: iron export ABC transporter permease subunit FetB [Proteobacteria bacterium]|nr:iron export ABC transporter permease subunit FetB [Pseudomonadota bacterium]
MTATYITLDYLDLGLAALLLVLNGALSIWLRLELERQFLIAALRMCVQLGLMGLVLKALFAVVSPWLTGLAVVVMVAFAGREVMARQETRFRGFWAYGLGTTSVLFAGTLVTVFALATQIQADPWYHPRYAIPLLGMILGNTMTGIAIGLNTLTGRVKRERAAIETMLALGETRAAAFRPFVRSAVRNGLIPIVNAMSAAGVVSLPGMMTGQILSGVEPMEAIKYQILIMFLIAGGTALGVVTAVHVGALRLSDARHRLRLDRLAGN